EPAVSGQDRPRLDGRGPRRVAPREVREVAVVEQVTTPIPVELLPRHRQAADERQRGDRQLTGLRGVPRVVNEKGDERQCSDVLEDPRVLRVAKRADHPPTLDPISGPKRRAAPPCGGAVLAC